MIRTERRNYFLSTLIALLVISLLELNSQTGSVEIRVMTYNIFHGEQAYNTGNSNLPQVAELINKVNPDFVALQEVDSMTNRSAKINSGIPKDLVFELSQMTGMIGFFGKAIDYSDGGYGEGILSKFPATVTKHSLPIPKG
ncbi:MAG TPA: endonuclease/exonuclease/phosphatase family protein, partial [Bacteroidales bacterium]|nr:endonuclease/exonuclease/phosphatase family protein [Bacteroidales bacterium]